MDYNKTLDGKVNLPESLNIVIFIYNTIVLMATVISVLISVKQYPYKAYFTTKRNLNIKFNVFCIFVCNLGSPTVLDEEVGFTTKHRLFNITCGLLGIFGFLLLSSLYFYYGTIRYLGYFFSLMTTVGLILTGIFHQDVKNNKPHITAMLIAVMGILCNVILNLTLEIIQMARYGNINIFMITKWCIIFIPIIIILSIGSNKKFSEPKKKLYGRKFFSKYTEWFVLPLLFLWLFIQSFSLLNLDFVKISSQ